MEKRISFMVWMLLVLCSLAGCKGSAVTKDYSQSFDITKKYLLIPIEDSAPEAQISINIDDTLVWRPINMRVARTKVDYWVPIDVQQFNGKRVELLCNNFTKGDIGMPMVKHSDTFDFDYNEQYRPAYHFSPKYGWTNDPNGMVYLNGEYHLYYQHNPYGSTWGNMHWGHAVTKDFKKWEHLPVAIAPDELGTIFSGSAVVDRDNTAGFGRDAIVAIYTYEGQKQTQGIAFSLDEGRTFTKYDSNPVIANPDIRDFRDPKVFWHAPTSRWVMSLATMQTITFYASPDLKNWSKLSSFGDGVGAHGGVWECPDLFPMRTAQGEQKWVLFVSINPGGPNGGSATQYFIGDFDGTQFKADKLPYPLWVDYGRDNYAGVTWSNVPQQDGRRIFMGWMSNWDYTNSAPTKNFRNAMTLPRELTIGSGAEHHILKNYPVAEILELRSDGEKIDNFTLVDKHVVQKLTQQGHGSYQIEFTMLPDKAASFGFRLLNSKGEYMEYAFDLPLNRFVVSRKNSGLVDFNDKFPSEDIAPIKAMKEYKIALFIDKASSELFINGGELAMTHTIFPSEPYNSAEFFSNGKMQIKDIVIYPIK